MSTLISRVLGISLHPPHTPFVSPCMLLDEITVLIGEIVAYGQALKFQEIMEGGFCTNTGQKIIVSSVEFERL